MTHQQKDEEYSKALNYLEKLFPSFPDFYFQINRVIYNSGLNSNDKKEALKLKDRIITLLVSTYRYADEKNHGFELMLTDKGRIARNKGGHLAYEVYIEQRDKPKPIIGTINAIGNNYGNTNQFGSDSSLNTLSQNTPATKPINPIINKSQKSFSIKKELKKLIIGILIIIISAIVLYYLKIKP